MGQGTVPCPSRMYPILGGTNDRAIPIQNIPCQRGCQIFACADLALRSAYAAAHGGPGAKKAPCPCGQRAF